MSQLYKNIQTDFPGQIFLELFQFKTRSLFRDTLYSLQKTSHVALSHGRGSTASTHVKKDVFQFQAIYNDPEPSQTVIKFAAKS